MERKIFNYQYDSRIKINFDDFKSCYWHLRSTIGKYDCVGGVSRTGLVSIYYILYDCIGILPVCTIWKSINRLVYKLKQSGKHFLDFWYNYLMEQTIFNISNKSRVKLDFDWLKSHIWGIRSATSQSTSMAGSIYYNGIVIHRVTKYCCYVSPICIIWKSV